MKGDKGKKQCDKACGAFVFLAIVLLAVSQLLGKEKYDESGKGRPGPTQTSVWCDVDQGRGLIVVHIRHQVAVQQILRDV